ncbi:ACSF3 [Lepeophtheirus salmonis]|uniref:ACSF3 n=1 Tax=Lepeophtheirus salmonis TaxID=72036 RepID=A0A7R8H667_LEPSM|nr:ACSF3 [Lepeophtheirus salmonis]CAF2894009.1 ACSF3 [Lepeophtheirus salmonis]
MIGSRLSNLRRFYHYFRGGNRIAISDGQGSLSFNDLYRDSSILAKAISSGTIKEAPPPNDPNDGALILYTSGTSGSPKGVWITHRNIEAQVSGMIKFWAWTSDDHILHVLPLYHLHGLINCLLVPLSIGARVKMLPGFDAKKVWSSYLTNSSMNISVFMGVPTIYSLLTKEYELDKRNKTEIHDMLRSTYRLMVCGSASLPEPLLRKWQTISGHILLERYGMTEIGMGLGNSLEEDKRLPGFVGTPFPNVEARIMSEEGSVLAYSNDVEFSYLSDKSGELQIRGPSVFSFYYGNEKATKESFDPNGDWFLTGDTASMNSRGVFKILGRTSADIIKSGGFKLSALEIEREYLSYPDISEIAVVGLEDEIFGEIVAAIIVPNKGYYLNSDILRGFGYKKLPPYSVPRQFMLVNSIDKNHMGKINKKELKKMDSPPDPLKESDILSDEQNTDTLNWSISNITAASDLKHDIIDSHIWCTPARLDSINSFVKLSFEEAAEEDETECTNNTSRRFKEFHQLKSKSPRKHNSTSSDYGSGRTSDRSTTILQTSSSSSNNTTITPFPPKRNIYQTNSILREERRMENEMKELKVSNESLILKLSRSEILLREKDSFIQRLEEQCKELGEVTTLKAENDELEKKISVYEMELEKALALASDFKGKIEEDETHRDKMLEEFVSERTLNSQQLTEERNRVVELTKDKNSLLNEMKTKYFLFKKEISDLQSHRGKFQIERRNENKTETHVHEFYQKQMESILAEKLQQLRSYIEELEKNMREENKKIIADIRQEQRSQVSSLKEKYTNELRKLVAGFDSERQSFRSSLDAARQEADALRDQIRSRPSHESSSLPQNNCIDDTSHSSALPSSYSSSSRALLHKIQPNS